MRFNSYPSRRSRAARSGEIQRGRRDGLLGRNILDNFNLIFDYPNGKLFVDSLVP